MPIEDQAIFRTDTGARLPGVAPAEHQRLLEALRRDYSLSNAQICEAASYSLAMVARVALGLSAESAKLAALAGDHINGWTVLAAVRHLVNAGSEVRVLLFDAPEAERSADLQQQLAPLLRMGVSIEEWRSELQETLLAAIAQTHAALCGLFSAQHAATPALEALAAGLNELRTPVHTVQAPLGVDLESGARSKFTLYASSTLSLGIPLKGLAPGSEYCGRHYLCDVSVPAALYSGLGAAIGPLFAEQPVVRIFPLEKAEDSTL